MKIAEKKAFRASNETLASSVQSLNDARGLTLNATIDPAPIETYDFDALGHSKTDVLGALGKVPASILDAMSTIAEDADYHEAFQEIAEVVFVPNADAQGYDFDYDQSATLEGDKLKVSYAPLAYMHGGYERSIKNCF